MGCVSSQKKVETTQNNKTTSSTPSYIINDKQLQLLKIIYRDVASRCSDNQMALQDFLLFFHKNGYWGQRLFNQFDTGHSKTVLFAFNIVKIFKSTEQQKIQLLYKFFSQDDASQGIAFNNFLKMLYNYPKEQFQKILNDSQFVNKQLKSNLVGIDRQVQGRRLMSLLPQDVHSSTIAGKAFRLQQVSSGQDKLESKYGTKILNQLNKNDNQRRTTFQFKVGQNNVQVKTTSVHQLVKKFAKSIFKNYQIDQKTGRMKMFYFKDWNMKHKNFYNDFFKGFHSQVWQVDKATNLPKYLNTHIEYSSKARLYFGEKSYKTVISLLQSILIVCEQNDNKNPICLICLQGLAATPVFDKSYGFGIQITHRNGIYQKKTFYLLNQQTQKQWMQYLKFFKGYTANQIYEIKQQIGIGKFSVVYHCIEKATDQHYAIKVIQSYKLDDQARKIIAHESSIMSVMSHPLLVFFKQTITTKTHIYIVTQLVKGKDLFSLVKDLRYFSEPQASYILEQIIVGVRYIHSLGIVHRDLKPENIMLQYSQQNSIIARIKIIDFGFANHLSNLANLQKDQLWAGTPNYIAPEILKQEQFDFKIDNFAIGSIMYFILSGNLPFNSIDVGIILQKTMEGAFPLNDKIWKGISQQAKDLVSKLLQNDPKDRISLDQALKHPWFENNRGNRQPGAGLNLAKQVTGQEKNKKFTQAELF